MVSLAKKTVAELNKINGDHTMVCGNTAMRFTNSQFSSVILSDEQAQFFTSLSEDGNEQEDARDYAVSSILLFEPKSRVRFAQKEGVEILLTDPIGVEELRALATQTLNQCHDVVSAYGVSLPDFINGTITHKRDITLPENDDVIINEVIIRIAQRKQTPVRYVLNALPVRMNVLCQKIIDLALCGAIAVCLDSGELIPEKETPQQKNEQPKTVEVAKPVVKEKKAELSEESYDVLSKLRTLLKQGEEYLVRKEELRRERAKLEENIEDAEAMASTHAAEILMIENAIKKLRDMQKVNYARLSEIDEEMEKIFQYETMIKGLNL